MLARISLKKAHMAITGGTYGAAVAATYASTEGLRYFVNTEVL
jgi:hypothetical protein